MSARRVRTTEVDGVAYGWVVAPYNLDEYLVVRVWLAALDRPRCRQLHVAVLGDPIKHIRIGQAHGSPHPAGSPPRWPITRYDIRDLVRAGIDAGWRPNVTGPPACFTRQIHSSGNGSRLIAGMPGPAGVRERGYGGRSPRPSPPDRPPPTG